MGRGASFALTHKGVCGFSQSFRFLAERLRYAHGSCHTHGMANELITAKEKAEQLGISRTQLSRLVKAGEITPSFKAPGANGVMLFDANTERVA